jgi:hydrogenase expression/formation protein HypD
MALLAEFRDRDLVAKVASEITSLSEGRKIRIMHVCGTHEWTITHFGLRDLLPENINIVAGPGCPVCVTPGNEIDAISDLAMRRGVVVTTFGDLLRVPGNRTSLSEASSSGGNVKVIYSVGDAVRMAREERDKEFVHFSIGFETTAPMTAVEVVRGPPANFSVFATHKLIPPAMEFLLSAGVNLDGFICPGHVTTIIGVKPYERLARQYKKPMVVSGFEPLDIMLGVLNIVRQMADGSSRVDNEYRRAVRDSGNEMAVEIMNRAFETRDAFWRGIGKIKGSGMGLRPEYSDHNAEIRFGMDIQSEDRMPAGCSCGDVLKGTITAEECPLFGRGCTPEHPIGPCMVSMEGTCSIAFKYRRTGLG